MYKGMGADIIYQAALSDGCFIGHADFLKRVPKHSRLGDFSYEVTDTKLARGSHVAVELLRRGYRIGVSSNSHKAINNLLSHVERVDKGKNMGFVGVKKSTQSNPDSISPSPFL